MSEPDRTVGDSTKNSLADRIMKLNFLLDTNEFIISDDNLESFFSALLNWTQKMAGNMPLSKYLDPAKQEKLARICLRGIDAEEPLGPAAINALKLLSILVKQLSGKPETTRQILDLIYASLVKKLHPPDDDIGQKQFHSYERHLKLKALSACCLNQINLKQILSPEDTLELIKNSILPLACWCLTMETERKKSTLQVVFKNGFHGLANNGNCCNHLPDKDLFYAYPQVIQLLVTLTKMYPVSSPSGVCRKELVYSLLDEARKMDKIKDEHVVALNVILAQQQDCSSETIEYLKGTSTDLFVESEGIQRIHLAYLTCHVFGMFPKPDDVHNEQLFAKTLIEDVITKEDKLLVEIALDSLLTLQANGVDWSKFTIGKENNIIKKLLETKAKPAAYNMFLKGFNYFTNDRKSIEFDQLAREPISSDIDKLDQLLGVKKRDKKQAAELEESLLRLAYLLRLRRHRLKETLERRLNELYGLLLIAGYEPTSPGPVDLLVFANSYQVYPSAWMTIRSLRLAAPLDNPPSITHKLLSHFILIDTENFFRFASTGVLEMILDDSCKNKTLLKEILVTFPNDNDKTNLSFKEYITMVGEYIILLLSWLASLNVADSESTLKKWMNTGLVREARPDQLVDLLAGLLVVFYRFREIMYPTLAHLGVTEQSLEQWLKENVFNWIGQVIEHEEECLEAATAKGNGFNNRVDLATILIAFETLKLVNEDFSECPEARETTMRLAKFINSSCDRGIQQSPVDSIVSQRCRKIKSSFRIGPSP